MKKKALYYLKISIAKCPFLSVTEKLPGTGIQFLELCYGGNVRVQTSVDRYNLSRKVLAFIGSQIDAHIGDIFRAAITIHHNVIQENIL